MQGGALLGGGEGPLPLEHRAAQGGLGWGGGQLHPVFRRLAVLLPALELGGGELGGDVRAPPVGIPPRQPLPQPRREGHARPGPVRRPAAQSHRGGKVPGGQQAHVPGQAPVLRGLGTGAVQSRPQGRAVPPAQHRSQHPLRHGPGGGHLPGGRRALGLHRQGRQPAPPPVDGGKQNQLVLRPGHGHVQKPQLLRAQLPPEAEGQGVPGGGGVPQAPPPVHPLGAQAQLRVEQDGGLGVGLVELPVQAAQQHHRELQPLGAVDGQNPHAAPLPAGNGHRDAVLRHPAQVEQEGHQPPVAPGLKPGRLVVQGHQVGPPPLPVRQGGEYRGHVQPPVNVPQQAVAALLRRQLPQLGQQGQQAGAVPFPPGRPGGEAVIHRAAPH